MMARRRPQRPRDPNQLGKLIVDLWPNASVSVRRGLKATRTRNMFRADPKHVSTSFAERQNLTLRMSPRRFTRLTNAFSKKLENHALSVALHYMHYNFCRIHKTLRVTPAMAAGVLDHVWSVADIVSMIDAAEPAPGKRGPYKKQAT